MTKEGAKNKECSATAAKYCEKGAKALGVGKYVEAMEYFQAAIETDRRFEKAYLLLSETYEKLGQSDKAKAALFSLLAIDPSNRVAIDKLQGHQQQSTPSSELVHPQKPISTKPQSTTGSRSQNTQVQSNAPLTSKTYDILLEHGRNRLYFKIYDNDAHVVAPNTSNDSSIVSCWSGYKEPEGRLQIPSVVVVSGKPYKVTAIDPFAFSCCDKIKSVEMPDTIVTIGKKSFQNCEQLRSVKLSSATACIEEYAFSHCALKSIILPPTVNHIGPYAFCDNPIKNLLFQKASRNLTAQR